MERPVERNTKAGSGGTGGSSVYYGTSGVASASTSLSESNNPTYNDPSSMLLSMWNRGKRSVGLGLTNREIAELRYRMKHTTINRVAVNDSGE